MARELEADLIVLDLAMPDKSGFEVLRLLKHDSSTAHIPVVICTSREFSNDDRFDFG
jgi:twitching motility two-component system response regulator PilH